MKQGKVLNSSLRKLLQFCHSRFPSLLLTYNGVLALVLPPPDPQLVSACYPSSTSVGEYQHRLTTIPGIAPPVTALPDESVPIHNVLTMHPSLFSIYTSHAMYRNAGL